MKRWTARLLAAGLASSWPPVAEVPRHRRHRPDCPGHRLPVRRPPRRETASRSPISPSRRPTGVDTVSGASRVVVDGKVLGNNQYLAQLLQGETGGDLFPIETVQTYPGDHDALLDFAYQERSDGARPALATPLENLDQYDVIFLGYPNWNSDLPMPLYTFLETYDFSGKTILPFTAHGEAGSPGRCRPLRTCSLAPR